MNVSLYRRALRPLFWLLCLLWLPVALVITVVTLLFDWINWGLLGLGSHARDALNALDVWTGGPCQEVA